MGQFLGLTGLLVVGLSAIPLWVAIARKMRPIGGIISLLIFAWFLLLIPIIGWFLTVLPWFGALVWASAGKTVKAERAAT